MKKTNVKIKPTAMLACLLSVFCMTAFSGCNPGNGGSIEIDPNKTQLYVFNFDSGYGTDWFNSLITRFEDYCKDDDMWEEGKKGVQIIPDNRKDWSFADGAGSILSSVNDVFFTEYMYFQAAHTEHGYADITDAMTRPLTEFGESKSIVDKMTAQQREYFSDPVETATGEGENGAYTASEDTRKYYSLPHYSGYEGIVYNIDLFDARGYWLSESNKNATDINMRFTADKNDLAAGPDGTPHTYDDGLPATYDEFYMLCDYIAADGGRKPLTWTGKYYKTYVMGVQTALFADYEGADRMKMNWSLDGEADDLLRTDTLAVDSGLQIDATNGYELARQAGRLESLRFIEKLIKTSKWQTANVFNSGISQTDAEDNFVNAGYDGVTNDIAMLIDGSWWENEAHYSIADVATLYGAPDGKSRKFGWLPLPKADKTKVEEAAAKTAAGKKAQTLYDTLEGQCFVNASIKDWKKPLAEKFIRFAHTDESLQDFSVITSSLKAFEYDLTNANLDAMTEYGRGLYRQRKQSEVVYPVSKNRFFSNNQSFFERSEYYASTVSGGDYMFAAEAFKEKGCTAEEFFRGMYTYQQKKWSGLVK